MINQWSFEENNKWVIAFDVDGCLITFNDKPKYKNITLFHLFQKLGCKVVIWSGGGEDYAKHWADKLGLSPDFVADKLNTEVKPDIAFDDERINLGKVNILV